MAYYTKDEAQERLREIADDIYENHKYVGYAKENGMYFISLKELRNTLKYDTKKVDNIDGFKCDDDETGVIIDIDNLENRGYYGNPVKTAMLCNPLETENESEE